EVLGEPDGQLAATAGDAARDPEDVAADNVSGPGGPSPALVDLEPLEEVLARENPRGERPVLREPRRLADQVIDLRFVLGHQALPGQEPVAPQTREELEGGHRP